MKILVTKKENVITLTDGNQELSDERAYGYLVKTHVMPLSHVDPETNTIQTGFVMRSEVYWENKRSPACTLEDPSDLAWLSFEDGYADEEGDSDEEAQDEDHDGEENETGLI